MANFTGFTDILKQGESAGMLPARTKQSRNWYRSRAGDFHSASPTTLLNQPGRLTNRLELGKMYLFSYKPKTSDTLPYYDRLPLVFPFRITPKSFYAINLHYLPPAYRAKLMDALYSLATDNKYNQKTHLQMTYNILNAASKFRYFKPCVKQYLNSNVQSRFMTVFANEWDMALFLPLERFEKASKQKVFTESIKQFQG